MIRTVEILFYDVPDSVDLSVPGTNTRHADLTVKEAERGYRVLGGDVADLVFDGYTVEGGRLIPCNPRIRTTAAGLDPDEVSSIAAEVVRLASASIGEECFW